MSKEAFFSSLPMGTEEYYLFISPENREITAADPATLNGKKVGINKGSIQADFYREWEQKNSVNSTVIEVTTQEEESLQMLETGELDAYVTVDFFTKPELAVPVYKIGFSDFYFAVSKERQDLLFDLNTAMNRIQDENRYYNLQMFEKYFKRTGANVYLSQEEVNWLSAHKTIRVGYQDNILSLCASDKETGELTGVLKDCLFYASDCVANAHPDFQAFPYATAKEAFSDWRKVYFSDTEKCLKAVSERVADCVLISNYRYNNLIRLFDRYHLTALTTGVGLDYCFAVGKGNTELYSILTKIVSLVPNSTVNAALSYYITKDAKLTLLDFIEDNLAVVMTVFLIVLLVILFLMVKSMRAEKKARELISATETDELTGLYNRNFFFIYANRICRDHPEIPMDAIVLNIDQFHSVNALNGRDFGDNVLRTLENEIRTISKQSGGIAGRFEADRFDIYCKHKDTYEDVYDQLQEKLENIAPNTSIRLRMGVMPWQKDLEPVQLFDMARTACSMARGHYKEHLIIFDEKVRKREIFEQRLQNDLRHSLDSLEFEVYYQPKYDIQSEPPRLVSAEALVRWIHPELGLISPNDFIPLFEKNGQISLIDKYVWTEAAKQIVKWKNLYGVTIPVSVNLSRVDVFDPMLEETLDGILKFHGLDQKALKLEVTESAYTENAYQVIRVVESLRKKGYEVEMDDFGTGYSSLNMLSEMPIDVLKMDRGFIRNIEHDEKNIQLVALILDIARNLKIPVVAEGVETEEQIRLLKELGCAIVQGYYFSKPLHASDFEAMFVKNLQLS